MILILMGELPRNLKKKGYLQIKRTMKEMPLFLASPEQVPNVDFERVLLMGVSITLTF